MRIVFMGTPAAAVPTLQRIVEDGHEVCSVWTQPDRPSGRGRKVAFSPVKEFAVSRGIPIEQPRRIRTEAALNALKSQGADAAVVVAYGRILPPAFLSAFRYGCINVHFSLLPKYRGAAPVNWAIIEGEETTGVTTMKMDEGLDTGDILLQAETGIGRAETSPDLTERLAELGADLLSRTLEGIATIVPAKQDDSLATYAPLLKKEDGIIGWDSTAASIERRIRGFQPFPKSYTNFRGKLMTVWKSAVVEGEYDVSGTGVIVGRDGGSPVVSCGEGTFLRLDEVQVQGKKRVGGADFVNGYGVKSGETLGEPDGNA